MVAPQAKKNDTHEGVQKSRSRTAMAFVRLRVAHTIESGFDHSLQLSQIFVLCALFSASIAGVCVQLHIDNLPRDTTGSVSGLVDGAFRN